MRIVRLAAALALLTALSLLAPHKNTPAPSPECVQRSNQNAALLLNVLARFSPESASRFGVEGHDTDITTLPLDINAKSMAAVNDVVKEVEARVATERDPAVRQDLQILINSGRQNNEGTLLGDKYQLPYFDIPQLIFQGERR